MKAKYWMLAVLYFVQGLPYGFQLNALPVYLRAEGVSLAGIGMAGALSLPWVFKVIWGPAVDRYGSERFGRRKSWIVPLQLLLALSCLGASFVEPSQGLMVLLTLVFTMNLFASTMDVAVDGLAVDVLKPHELGYGNIAQVVGYKVGILTGGGLLIQLSPRLGWSGIFVTMAALVLCGLVLTLLAREPGRRAARRDALVEEDSGGDDVEARQSMGEILLDLGRSLKRPGALWLLLFIGTYKLGESMADSMFKPFLYDAGYTAEQIGLWVGTYGLGFSLLGSFLGGLAASRFGVFRAVAATATLRALAVGGEWWLSLVEPTVERVVLVVTAEQCFGGALTTAIFAFMMSRVDRSIGATHFTFLATVEVAGKLAASWVSGFVAQSLGYSSLFAVATTFAVLFLTLLYPISRSQPSPVAELAQDR